MLCMVSDVFLILDSHLKWTSSCFLKKRDWRQKHWGFLSGEPGRRGVSVEWRPWSCCPWEVWTLGALSSCEGGRHLSLVGPVLSKRRLKSLVNIHEAHPAESSGNLNLGGESQSSQTPRKFCLWGVKSPLGREVGHLQMDRATCSVVHGLLERCVLANSTSGEMRQPSRLASQAFSLLLPFLVSAFFCVNLVGNRLHKEA